MAVPYAAIGQAALGGITDIWNALQYEKNYKRQKQDEAEIYARSRKDTLEDWNRANEYNAPLQQMTRLRQAGLNPNLVYGKGADNTASSISSPKGEVTRLPPQQVSTQGFNTALQLGASLKQSQAQTDNLHEQNKVLQKEALLKETQIGKTLEDTASTKFQRENALKFQDNLFIKSNLDNEMLKSNLETQKQSRELAFNADQRAEIQLTTNLKKTAQDILTQQLNNTVTPLQKEHLEAQIEAVKNTNIITDWENQMRKQNINPKDPVYIRKFQELLEKIKSFGIRRTNHGTYEEYQKYKNSK